jgi:hypothetical protein
LNDRFGDASKLEVGCDEMTLVEPQYLYSLIAIWLDDVWDLRHAGSERLSSKDSMAKNVHM